MEFVDGRFELREVQKLEGHTDRVWSLAWNPATGVAGIPSVFASCSGDKTVRIWEQSHPSTSWECKAVLEETHTRTVRSCAWSPSGKLLATSSFDATAAIWENVGGDFECVSTLEGHENEVKSISWNASGSFLATCGRDKTVWIWEVLPGNEFECVSVLQGHTQDVKMVKWHPTMDVLFSCSYDNSIKIWADECDGDDWVCVQTLDEPNKYIPWPCSLVLYLQFLLLCFICLVVLFYFNNFHELHVSSNDTTLLGIFASGHSSTVWALSFSSTGDKMVTCSDDLTLKIWGTDLARMQSGDGYAPWRHLSTIAGHHDRTIFSVHWSREGIIASGAADDAIRFFVEDNDTDGLVDGPKYKLLLKEEKAHDMDVNSVQWSPGEKRILASASDDGTVKIWELASLP
ncbi:hypothetical protein TIFTF001_008698 [Ficus carica]|uniref:Probable cytosolic iron-sulfur protein assembly protein CIAO1 homolog n=1 Tax=Ficus carica TaxID=3494 RepID=A0AA88D333_FICCA|nr:hypothetical protein TIFTF001_008698 [Ficus carica]